MTIYHLETIFPCISAPWTDSLFARENCEDNSHRQLSLNLNQSNS